MPLFCQVAFGIVMARYGVFWPQLVESAVCGFAFGNFLILLRSNYNIDLF